MNEIMNRKIDALIRTLRYGNQLKRTSRTGWVQRGVPDAEDVAAHTFGAAFAAWIIAQTLEQELDMGKVLSMALLHDLPEVSTTDIPTPSWRLLPDGSKRLVEDAVMLDIFSAGPFREEALDLWNELQELESLEAKLVHDADRIDMYLQATVYAEQSGNLLLEEFWMREPEFFFPISRQIYDVLAARSREVLGF